MADFAKSMATAQEASQKRNPFGVILDSWNKAQGRRYEEDAQRKKEEGALKNALTQLGANFEYDKTLAAEKAQEERKTGLFENLSKGEAQQTAETGAGTFEGTPFGIPGRIKATPKTGLEDFKKELEIKKLLREEQASTPEGQKGKAVLEGEAKAISKSIEMTEKMATAVRRLALINKQFKEALPTGDKTPLEQRIAGKAMGFATKFGFVDNPKLLALKKNVRPMAINLIRLFGEVGNLSQTEQQGAIDIVNQEGLTEKERIASTKQFIEYSLVGAPPDAKNLLKKQKDIQGILSSFGVDLFTEAGQQAQNIPSFSSEQEAEASGVKGEIIINGRPARID